MSNSEPIVPIRKGPGRPKGIPNKKPVLDMRPIDVILEEQFRDWLTRGVPYENLEDLRYSKKTNPDGTPKKKLYRRRRPLTLEDTKLIIAFLNRKQRLQNTAPKATETQAEKTAAEKLREEYDKRFKLGAK